MAIEFDVRDDFAAIVDGGEPISLRRQGSADLISVPRAWRFSSETTELRTGIADVARNDIVWQFSWDESLDLPNLGDVIIDSADRCWTIVSVSEFRAKSRLRCLARNLYFVHAINDRIEIQEAIWDGELEPMVVGWRVLRSAVPARIQPTRVTVESEESPVSSESLYRIVLGEQIPLDHNHRLIGPDGSIYEITTYEDAERIDTLPMATVRKLSNG